MVKKERLDLTGMRFGKLIVTGPASKDKHGGLMWNVICDCGTEKTVRGINLTSGSTKSCGCSKNKFFINDGRMNPYELVAGDVFGKLMVVNKLDCNEKGHKYYYCECDCGGNAVVRADNLISGRTKSCGCLRYKRKVPNNFDDW